jgi:hypothetical protein
MEPQDVPWLMQQAAPAQLWLRLRPETLPNDVYDFTGYTANWEIWNPRRTVKFAEVAVDFPNRLDGQVRGRLTAAQTLLIPVKSGKAVHDLHLFPPVGDDFYAIKGSAVAAFRVSREAP